MNKISALILFALSGCSTPHFQDGTKASYVAQPDRCDREYCNVGKKPWKRE